MRKRVFSRAYEAPQAEEFFIVMENNFLGTVNGSDNPVPGAGPGEDTPGDDYWS